MVIEFRFFTKLSPWGGEKFFNALITKVFYGISEIKLVLNTYKLILGIFYLIRTLILSNIWNLKKNPHPVFFFPARRSSHFPNSWPVISLLFFFARYHIPSFSLFLSVSLLSFFNFSVSILLLHCLRISVPSLNTRHSLQNVVSHIFLQFQSLFPVSFFTSFICYSFPGGVFFLLSFSLASGWARWRPLRVGTRYYSIGRFLRLPCSFRLPPISSIANLQGENFMATFTTLSVVIWFSTGTLGIFATLVYVFPMRVVIYDILSMAIIPTLSTSILFCNLCYIYYREFHHAVWWKSPYGYSTLCNMNTHKKINTLCGDFYHTIIFFYHTNYCYIIVENFHVPEVLNVQMNEIYKKLTTIK